MFYKAEKKSQSSATRVLEVPNILKMDEWDEWLNTKISGSMQ